jgi:hypothetical protein
MRERAQQLEVSVFKEAEELRCRPESPSWVGDKSWLGRSWFGESRFGKKFGEKFGKTEAEKCAYWTTVLAWLLFPAAIPKFWCVPPISIVVYFIAALVIFILTTLSLFSQVKFKDRAQKVPSAPKADAR